MRFDRTNEMNGLASLLIVTCLATAGACGKDVPLGSGKVGNTGTAGAASPGRGGDSGATAGSGSAGSAGTIGSVGGAGGSGNAAGSGGSAAGSGGGVPVTPPPGSCLCTAVVDPVCAVDGKTYDNTCLATCHGVAVAYKGPCTDAATDTSADGAVVCAPPGVTCVFCTNGYQTGAGGCRTCACNPGGDASADTSPDAPMCRGPGVACGNCPNGYLTGPGGCPTCACKP
jgi:hypothetical protein